MDYGRGFQHWISFEIIVPTNLREEGMRWEAPRGVTERRQFPNDHQFDNPQWLADFALQAYTLDDTA